MMYCPDSKRECLMKAAGQRTDLTKTTVRAFERGLEKASSDVSIRRLQAFWSIAHTGSMTRAACSVLTTRY